MNTLRWLRLCALGALSSSAAAAVDRYTGSSAFCAPTGGCALVASTGLGEYLSPYLPAVGLVGFSLVFWGSMSLTPRIRRAALYAGVLSGLMGLGLLAVQWLEVREFCTLCLGADLSALAVALMSALSLRNMKVHPSSWPLTAWTALFVLAVGIPPVYAAARPAPVPDYVRQHRQPGKLNVVEVSDFECPYCRRLHEPLEHALSRYDDEVHFVRLPYPLPGHPHAEPAARAYLCATDQGRGDAMVDALFSRDLATLDLVGLAPELGLDAQALAACMESPRTRARLEATMRSVAAGGLSGLPTVYIGHERLEGFDVNAGAAPYEAALARAARGHRPTHRPLPWIALGLVLLVLVTISSRRSPARGKKSA